MPYLKKTNPGISVSTLIAADQWNDFVGRVTGEVLADTSFEWNIANPTRFKTNALRLWHAGGTDYAYRFVTSTLTASRDIIVPVLPGNDTLVFLALAQSFTNKVLDLTLNSIIATGATTGSLARFDGTKFSFFNRGTAGQLLRTNLAGTNTEWVDPPSPVPPGGFSYGGVATFSGNASTKIFNIAHGAALGTPDIAYAQPTGLKPDTFGEYDVSWDGTNVIITYQTAPPTGTNNLKFVWGAGYIGEADPSSFTATTSNVLQNKTISGASNTLTNIPFSAIAAVNTFMTFNKVATPANPSTEDIILYDKEIDADNNTLATKQQLGGAIVEVFTF